MAGSAALVLALVGVAALRPAIEEDERSLRTADTTRSTAVVNPFRAPTSRPIGRGRHRLARHRRVAVVSTRRRDHGLDRLGGAGPGRQPEPLFPVRRLLDDGAGAARRRRLSPAEDRWRLLAPSPSTLVGPVVVVGDTMYATSFGVSLLAYDITRDRWDEVTNERGRIAGARLEGPVDGSVLLRSAGGSSLFLLDPTQGTVEELEPAPLPPMSDVDDATIVDGRILLTGREIVVGDEGPHLLIGAIFDPDAGWRRIPDSEVLGNGPMIEAGGLVVDPSSGGADGGEVERWDRPYPYGGVFDPGTERWSELPPDRPPMAWTAGYLPSPSKDARSTGREVLTADGLLLDPRAGTWRAVPAPPGVAERSGAAVTWAGDRIFVWGGASWASGSGMLLGAGFAYVPEP